MLKKSLLLGSSLILAAAMAMPAQAQDDEIIVTATKREQTLQEVPIAVTVTDAVTIERAQILDLKDLQSVVPTLRIPTFQNSIQSNFIIRGFGNGANNPGIEPSVGVFIDGVYRSRAAAQIGDLPKLERIEVISGPQSTLFGKNASVGVISIVTAKPSFENTGFVELGYGNYNQINAEAYLSGALSENVAGAISGSYNNRDGYFESLTPGVSDTNDRNRFNIRGDLLWQPNDDVEFRLIGDYSTIDEVCCTAVQTDILDAAPALGTGQNGTVLQGAQQALFGLIGNDPNDPFAYEIALNVEPVNEIDDYGVSLHSEFKLGNVDVTSITAYRVTESFEDLDADFSNVDFLSTASNDVEINTFTQELRFSGTAFNDRATWTAGGFYFNENIDFDSQLGYASQTRPLFAALIGGAGGPAAGEATFAGIELANGLANGSSFSAATLIDETFTLDNESFSVFGNVDFDVTDRFVLTVGAAYIDDSKEFTGSSVNGDIFSNIDLFGQSGVNVVLPGAFPQFAASCIDPSTGAPFAPLPFSPANLGAVTASPACFINPADLTQTAPGNLAFAGFQQSIAGLVASPANPLAGLAALQFQPNFFALPNGIEDNTTDDNEVTFVVRGSYDVTDDVNIYASYSTGYKASSVNLSRNARPNLNDFVDANGRPIAANFALLPNNFSVRTTDGQLISNTITEAAIPANAVVDPLTARNFGTRAVDPEETENIEIGLKSRFDKGSFNLTFFQTTVDGFQSNVFNGAAFVLANAGEQRSRGAEWDLKYSPIEALQLSLAGAYIDAEYIDFQQSTDIFNIPQNRSGSSVAGIAPWRLSVGATYNHAFENGWEGYIRGDYQFESNVTLTDAGADFDAGSSVVNSAIGPVPIASATNFTNLEREVSTFNFGVGLDFQNGFALQGYIRNAFNDEYLITTFNTPGLAGLIRGYPSQPRTYGILGRYSF